MMTRLVSLLAALSFTAVGGQPVAPIMVLTQNCKLPVSPFQQFSISCSPSGTCQYKTVGVPNLCFEGGAAEVDYVYAKPCDSNNNLQLWKKGANAGTIESIGGTTATKHFLSRWLGSVLDDNTLSRPLPPPPSRPIILFSSWAVH